MHHRNRRRPEGPYNNPEYYGGFGNSSRSSGAYDAPDAGGYTGSGRYQGDSRYGTGDRYNDQEYAYRNMRNRDEDPGHQWSREQSRPYDSYDEYGDSENSWRGYESSDDWQPRRGYEDDQNPERSFQRSRGFSRGGYETGYGEHGMKGGRDPQWRQGDYGRGSYRGFNENDRRDNRGGYGTQDNPYDDWNLGNYGSRGMSERDHYGYRGNDRGRDFVNW